MCESISAAAKSAAAAGGAAGGVDIASISIENIKHEYVAYLSYVQ